VTCSTSSPRTNAPTISEPLDMAAHSENALVKQVRDDVIEQKEQADDRHDRDDHPPHSGVTPRSRRSRIGRTVRPSRGRAFPSRFVRCQVAQRPPAPAIKFRRDAGGVRAQSRMKYTPPKMTAISTTAIT